MLKDISLLQSRNLSSAPGKPTTFSHMHGEEYSERIYFLYTIIMRIMVRKKTGSPWGKPTTIRKLLEHQFYMKAAI